MKTILKLVKRIRNKVCNKSLNSLSPQLAKDTGAKVEVITLPSGKQVTLISQAEGDSTENDTDGHREQASGRIKMFKLICYSATSRPTIYLAQTLKRSINLPETRWLRARC